METIPVKKFRVGNLVGFRFPYRTAWTRSAYESKLPSSLLAPEIFDDNHQSVLVATPYGDICAMGRSDGWARANAELIELDPSSEYKTRQDFRCSTVYRALEREGKFQVGDYTYVVSP